MNELDSLPYEREIRLKEILNEKLNDAFVNDPSLFKELSLWIILSQGACKYFLPSPNFRNMKIMAFDVNVLIRLRNLDYYKPL